jgi:tRNA A-37 threonylcarbamoyl transferase component Bud32
MAKPQKIECDYKKGAILGEGTYGKVYEYCIEVDLCHYVIKEQPYRKTIFDEEMQVMKTTNKVHKKYPTLAPQIYKVMKCDNKIITIMDKVEGVTVSSLLKNKKFDINKIKNLINSIKKIHSCNEFHGDINPNNIMYNEKTDTFTFIDFTIWNGYIQSYDFVTILYYLNSYMSYDATATIALFLDFIDELKNDNEIIQNIKIVYNVSYNTRLKLLNKEYKNLNKKPDEEYYKKITKIISSTLKILGPYIRLEIYK